MYNYSNYDSSIYTPATDTVQPSNKAYNQNLFNTYEGFIRGNMFSALYEPYTSTEPYNVVPQNEREALLDKVREYNFATTDLNLYLDTHPDDVNMIKTYNQYSNLLKQTTTQYENKYGPLTLNSDTLNSYPWVWLAPPWPWEEC